MTETVLTPTSLAGLKVSPVEDRSPYLNILIYGESGVGKTTFAGSADAVSALRPVLFVDIEGGTESLREPYPGCQIVRVQTWTEMQKLYDELYVNRHGFQTVVLDSLTEIMKFNMYEIMGNLARTRPDLDPDIPGMREWGKNIEQLRRFVRGFRDLPMHTIFTALERSDKDQKTGLVTKMPSLSGKVASEVAGFLDIVLYYYVKQIGQGEDSTLKRIVLAQKTEGQVAKDRTRKLPMVIESPTMELIFNYISKGNKA